MFYVMLHKQYLTHGWPSPCHSLAIVHSTCTERKEYSKILSIFPWREIRSSLYKHRILKVHSLCHCYCYLFFWDINMLQYICSTFKQSFNILSIILWLWSTSFHEKHICEPNLQQDRYLQFYWLPNTYFHSSIYISALFRKMYL